MSISDILDLMAGGWAAGRSTFASLDEVREFYWNNASDFIYSPRPGIGNVSHEPGCRPWAFWLAELVDNPRIYMRPDSEAPLTSTEVCHDLFQSWWGSSDGYEPAILYLLRRQLLVPGELEATASHAYRWRETPKRFFESHDPEPHDLVALRTVLDPNDSAGLLTAAEIESAREAQRLWESRIAQLTTTRKAR